MSFDVMSKIFEHRGHTYIRLPCWQIVKVIHVFVNFVEVEGM